MTAVVPAAAETASASTVVAVASNGKGHILHDGPAYSLALNKEHTHVVVAGRNGNSFFSFDLPFLVDDTFFLVVVSSTLTIVLFPVFKVFLIEQGGFKECVNLRCGKTSSVQSSSSMDVAWNPADGKTGNALFYLFMT